MKVQVRIDINTKELGYLMLNNLIDNLRELYNISEEDINKDSLILLIDEIYKEMKKEMEE